MCEGRLGPSPADTKEAVSSTAIPHARAQGPVWHSIPGSGSPGCWLGPRPGPGPAPPSLGDQEHLPPLLCWPCWELAMVPKAPHKARLSPSCPHQPLPGTGTNCPDVGTCPAGCACSKGGGVFTFALSLPPATAGQVGRQLGWLLKSGPIFRRASSGQMRTSFFKRQQHPAHPRCCWGHSRTPGRATCSPGPGFTSR